MNQSDLNTRALNDVIGERLRQINEEGWTEEHDDEHSEGQIALAAGWYALNASSHYFADFEGVSHPGSAAYPLFSGEYSAYCWPWDAKWWKPKNARRDLVRAAALIVAEIERIDRRAPSEVTGK